MKEQGSALSKGTVLQATFGKVRVIGSTQHGVKVMYLDGVFREREALIDKGEARRFRVLPQESA